MYLRSSIKIVSIVYSRFQPAKQGRRDGSTLPERESTQGTLIFETNCTVGGTSGYSEPQWMLTLYIRFSWALCHSVSGSLFALRLVRTWGGPRMVPFQLDIIKSSPSVRPYEQASERRQN